jgi:hypothetical protein
VSYALRQVRALLSAASGERLEALYVLAVHTGMRQGDDSKIVMVMRTIPSRELAEKPSASEDLVGW